MKASQKLPLPQVGWLPQFASSFVVTPTAVSHRRGQCVSRVLSSSKLITLLAVVATGAAMAAPPLPKVKLFTTGGTIQSRSLNRDQMMEYSDGPKVTPEELIADLPELNTIADISYTEISNVGSPSVNTEIMLKLAKGINEWLAKPEA